ncbi:hypothetical protein K439DRAFT_1372647 [Ramaria rubella]|nr:hypothetical protein K439DRAFT_1372647 [Ramaria rubella]
MQVNKETFLRLGTERCFSWNCGTRVIPKADLDIQVKKQVLAWSKTHRGKTALDAQLTWEVHVVEYVDFVHKKMHVHASSKNALPHALPSNIPLFGPYFLPPSYLHVQKRKTDPIAPQTAYMKPLTIIHLFYYPELEEAGCPNCGSKEIVWEGWTSMGAREVHGVKMEEVALGRQLQCKICETEHQRLKGAKKEGAFSGIVPLYCFASTNNLFWLKWEHW